MQAKREIHHVRNITERYMQEHPEVNWYINEVMLQRVDWVLQTIGHRRRDVRSDEQVSRTCGVEDHLTHWQKAIRRGKIRLSLIPPHWSFCLTWWCLIPVRRKKFPRSNNRCRWHFWR